MQRRHFLLGSAASPGRCWAAEERDSRAPRFSTANRRWQQAYDKALEALRSNVQVLPRFDAPVLIEGAEYPGVWQECGPHEAFVYRHFRPDAARNGHLIFFDLQRPDGQIPACNKRSGLGFGQIQMAVPIAATAWELARCTGDDELLHRAYDACSRWDDWLMRYRNTRGTGLVEGFCTYDTGHDNSPRWAGVPDRCPGGEARNCPSMPGLPRLCPDLSATVYGARLALAAMAGALGKPTEAARWMESAERLRRLILARLFDPQDGVFYDLDARGEFVRVRSDLLSRVCAERVLDRAGFEALWDSQLHNPKAFWAPFPLPSIALDDPAFVRPIPRNSWGGAAQALTALRTGRWFDRYEKFSAHAVLMDRWCEALQRDMGFRQQLDPLTGDFTQADPPGYSPAALAMVDFTWRLAGVREEYRDGQEVLEWNVRPGHSAAEAARFSVAFDRTHSARLEYGRRGAALHLDGRLLGRIESGTARLVTDRQGRPLRLEGIGEGSETVLLHLAGRPAQRFTLAPNRQMPLL
jgi:hypothetical protein